MNKTISKAEMTQKAQEVRSTTIEMIGHTGFGHIGGCMSVVEVLTVLYYKYMNIDPKQPEKPDRDRLVLSKGHAGPTLFAILSDLGFFPEEWLKTVNNGGTRLPSHCNSSLTPGVDFSTGSLGQGLSVACGMALGQRMDSYNSFVYCIVGDGESQEGQIWEAAMFAAQMKIGSLIAFTDYNHMQIDGMTEEVNDFIDLAAKWKSFGWHTVQIDGHNIEAIDRAVEEAQRITDKPSMIILDTVKGKGCSFAEGKLESHYMLYGKEEARDAISKFEEEV